MRLPLFLFLFVLLPAVASATHNRAGEIIVRTEAGGDGLTACATIITYTDAGQTEVDRDSLQIDWGDGAQVMIGRTSIVSTTSSGIQRNEYRLCHRYADFGRYVLSFQDVNRVANIRNIGPSSVNIPFSVSTSFALVNPLLEGRNDSPVLTQDPVDNACVGSVWTHNPGAYDVDGDSLAFEFTVPTFAPGSPVPGYVLPSQVNGGNGNLQVDPRTGQITWDSPAVPGEYALAVMVKSFRDGLPVDTLVRDMSIFVDDCLNTPPMIKLTQPDVTVIAGEAVSFEVIATAGEAEEQLVSLTADGYPFRLADNPASFLPTAKDLLSDTQRSTFRWQTTPADAREQPYFVVIRAADSGAPAPTGLATLRTVSIRVVATAPYQLFRPGVQYMYEDPEFESRTYGFDTEFYGVRVDSLGCGELYGSLEKITENDAACVVKVPSPFGYRICQTPDSTVMHFDGEEQLVLYHTAVVGTRWLARNDNGVRLYAEVLSVASSTVLGITDTLKTIGFFTEGGDASGPTVTIGQNTGLVGGTRFYQVDRERSPLTLAGVSEPAVGVQLPPASKFGLAEVGDTFQVAASGTGALPPPFTVPGGVPTSFVTAVILAVDSSRDDVYTYEVEADLYRKRQGQAVPFAVDTVFTFDHARLPADMMRQPGARQDTTFFGSGYSDLLKVFRDSCGLMQQRLSTPASFEENEICGLDQAELDANPGPVFVERVPFHVDNIISQAGPQAIRLQYFGSEAYHCGIYLEAAEIIVSNAAPPVWDAIPVEVFPNPTTGALTVTLPDRVGAYDLTVYDLSGKQLRTVKEVRGRHTLSLDGVPSGAYFLVVRGAGGAVARRRVVVW
ncbi:T9SS type A sorting domain-containing protein [Lewinella sp. IMCC34191]|uniref:T9SS type A sorting domain-containing protein n=1 Tax=Lewinella sp. IMCC34191 TaxID=2259172 RepID=UPI000E236045|nr:T9SS type A sorting domain-containing protein [Lewinella sp. IMCC34191]